MLELIFNLLSNLLAGLCHPAVEGCEEGQFECPSTPGQCIDPSKLCDGHKDCDENEDETGCSKLLTNTVHCNSY